MAPDFSADSLCIQISQASCDHNRSDFNRSENTYQNISCITATLQHKLTSIGTIKASLLNKAAMDALSPTEMWWECQAYDEVNASEAKLNKVENFLANESFPSDRQVHIDDARSVLYINEAYIEPPFRRRGLSLLALDPLILELAVGHECIVLLQAGSVVRFEIDEQPRNLDATEACEKITRHWRRMGFRDWSDSDDTWLCLLTHERPKIEDVVPELFAKTSGRENSSGS